MELLSTKSIEEFENEFISYYRTKIVGNKVYLSKDEFQKALRVFFWYEKDKEFTDIREVCRKTIALMNDKDPLNLGLLQFLNIYVKDGDLDCTNFLGGISNNIPKTLRALLHTYEDLMKERFPELDVSILSELEAKFEHLENARKFVLMYIGEYGHKHLSELSLCSKLHPAEVEDILHELVMDDDEKTSDEITELHKFVVKIVDSTELDLVTNQSWITQSIQDFIIEYGTDDSNI